MEVLFNIGYVIIISGMVWRFICLFRKKGSCKFRRCPFRKQYTNMSDVYFPSGGCRKCPPTPEELEIYNHSAEGIVEKYVREHKDNKKK